MDVDACAIVSMYTGSDIALEGESNDFINCPTLHPPLSEKCQKNVRKIKKMKEKIKYSNKFS